MVFTYRRWFGYCAGSTSIFTYSSSVVSQEISTLTDNTGSYGVIFGESCIADVEDGEDFTLTTITSYTAVAPATTTSTTVSHAYKIIGEGQLFVFESNRPSKYVDIV